MHRYWLAGAAVALATPALAPAAPWALTIGDSPAAREAGGTVPAATAAVFAQPVPLLPPPGHEQSPATLRLCDCPLSPSVPALAPQGFDLPPALAPWPLDGLPPPHLRARGGGGASAGGASGVGAPRPVPAPVPEPAAWIMMLAGLGLAGLGLRRRRALA